MLQKEYTVCEPSDQVSILVIKDSSSVGVYGDPFLVVRPVSLKRYKFCFALEQRT